MTSVGPNSPSSAANIAGSDVDWANPTNALASDDSRATAALTAGQVTDRLATTNYGFALSSTAVIEGIKVEVEASRSSGTGACVLNRVGLTKNGTAVVGSDDTTSSSLSTTDTYYTRGGVSELWGTTWTATEINTSTFGALSRCAAGSPAGPSARIDHVRITVYSIGITAGGTLGSSGALVRKPTKVAAGTLAMSGGITKSVKKVMAGGLSFLGSLLATTSHSGSVSLSMGGTIGLSGVLTKSVSKGFAGSLGFAGALVRGVTKRLAGSLGLAGDVAQVTPTTVYPAITGITVSDRLATVEVETRLAEVTISAREARVTVEGRDARIVSEGRRLEIQESS